MAIVTSLVEQGKVYADGRGKAVFLMVTGKPNRPIGAELRGTGHRRWRGLAPGTLVYTSMQPDAVQSPPQPAINR